MNFEEKIEDCKYFLNQINHFNPDPYYINHFLKEFIESVIDVYDGIIEEARRDFGLNNSKKSSIFNFENEARKKKDKSALEFLNWYNKNFCEEHIPAYPNFVNKILVFFREHNELPKINVKILADERYENDIVQEIKIKLVNGKLKQEELKIEIKRQVPLFLEIINKKREDNDEPRVSEGKVAVSTFLELEGFENMEIPYTCEIYLPVLIRIVENSKDKINKLTRFSN